MISGHNGGILRCVFITQGIISAYNMLRFKNGISKTFNSGVLYNKFAHHLVLKPRNRNKIMQFLQQHKGLVSLNSRRK